MRKQPQREGGKKGKSFSGKKEGEASSTGESFISDFFSLQEGIHQ